MKAMKKQISRRKETVRNFTLIELLVVIAIIAGPTQPTTQTATTT